GHMIAGFIAPDTSVNYTYPFDLKLEIKENIGDYLLDVNFRIDVKEELLKEIYEMTEIQFETIKYLIKNKEWNYTQFVIIGLDRFHHAFWKYFDRSHQLHEPGNKFEGEAKKFYNYLDRKIGEILELLDDNTLVMVVSDHGAKAMKGLICVNMALEKLGLLTFKQKPEKAMKIDEADIDWEKTYAWGWGGYYARIFMNVEGREKHGIIKQEDYEKIRDEIISKLKSIRDNYNKPMNTRIFKPQELFPVVRGNPPDLMVYFDDLYWRSAGTVGYESMYLKENDTGPDDAVHDYYGVFIIYDPKRKIGKNLGERSLIDIAPTSLNFLGIDVPDDMEGQI
ncbi:MAG: alkaline phosphatase family protein, partial [Promethearchaeota archaeon]